MKKWLEKQFQLSSYGTNVKTELLAGLTTFVTMAYVLATVPSLLGNAGLDRNVMFTAMILLIILTTCAMAFYTNRPFALAPGLGSVGIVASMISNEGISAPVAAGVIFWSGVLFILISFLGLREAVVRTIPVSLKQAVSAGIGLFIALLGAKNCGLIVAEQPGFRGSGFPIRYCSCYRLYHSSGDPDEKCSRRHDPCYFNYHSDRNSFRSYRTAFFAVFPSGRHWQPIYEY